MKETIPKNLKQTVAANLVKFRKQKKMKQRQVADQIFVSLKAYQSYEEQRAMPGAEVLFSLKELYKLPNIDCFYY